MTTPQQPTTAELITQLSDEVSRLVRQEVRQAQTEMVDKARQSAKGAAMLGAAGVLAAMAAGTAATFVLRVVDKVLPPGTAALVATGALGGGAAALALAGIQELRTVDPVPQRTLDSVRTDVAAVRTDLSE